MDDREIIEYYTGKLSDRFKGLNIGLIGSLGSGKTSLVRKIIGSIYHEAEKLIHSPTFNLCNIYQFSKFEVHHFDLYRIESTGDLFEIGIWESMENIKIITFIEWIDLFPELMENCNEIVSINVDNKNNRSYEVKQCKEYWANVGI